MSEKEKAIIEKIAALPDPLKQRFIDQADGALMAMDVMGKPMDEQPNETADKGG